jgi:hypothetical protein
MMSGMPDFEAGQLVHAVTQLTKDLEVLTVSVDQLNKRLAEQEIQLAKGKGMAAGALALAALLGGLGAYIMGKQ